MKQKLKKLIIGSQILNEKEKEFYLKLIEVLPDEKLEQLAKIFEKESDLPNQVQDYIENQKADLNARFVEESDLFFKKELKQAMEKEETEEKKKAEELLKKLNEL